MKRRSIIPLVLILSGIQVRAQTPPGPAPVFAITPDDSSIKFKVKASIALNGDFKKWDATLSFASTDPTSGFLDIKVKADTVNCGGGAKNRTIKGKDFFNVKVNPYITFRSTKIVQSSPDTFEVDGIFTIRGVSKPEKLTLTVFGGGTGEGIRGQMAFDRKEYGMTSGVPFIKIADRVEVDVDLKAKRVSGPAMDLKR